MGGVSLRVCFIEVDVVEGNPGPAPAIEGHGGAPRLDAHEGGGLAGDEDSAAGRGVTVVRGSVPGVALGLVH